MTPGEIFKAARKSKGLNQRKLAALTGIPQSVIAKIELDSRQADPEERVRLCEALDEDPGRLYIAEAKKFGAARLTLAELARLSSQAA